MLVFPTELEPWLIGLCPLSALQDDSRSIDAKEFMDFMSRAHNFHINDKMIDAGCIDGLEGARQRLEELVRFYEKPAEPAPNATVKQHDEDDGAGSEDGGVHDKAHDKEVLRRSRKKEKRKLKKEKQLLQAQKLQAAFYKIPMPLVSSPSHSRSQTGSMMPRGRIAGIIGDARSTPNLRGSDS